MKPYVYGALVSGLFLTGCTVQPSAFTDAEFTQKATTNLNALTVDQEPIDGEITLYEAMARALKYNLDYRVEMMNHALARKSLACAPQ